MAQYQLKVMLNTSIPSDSGYVELTSDILNYTPPDGKGKTLVKYPFFDPNADYPRQDIQDLEYYKRVEVFFNAEKFKSMVLQYSGQTKTKKKGGASPAAGKKPVAATTPKQDNKTKVLTLQKAVPATTTTKEEDEKNKQKKKISNFEFTIQTLLCTGFPVNNYFQSMEYYDPSIRTKSLTLKGSSWFPFLPGRFDRKFSYLKIGGGLYTVAGVVWVNDALSHPKYSPVLESYNKYSEEKNEEVIKKKQNELKTKREIEINLFILNLYRDNLNQNSTIWKSANVVTLNKKKLSYDSRQSNGGDPISIDIQIAFQEDILQKLLNAPEINNLFEDLSYNDLSGGIYKYSSVIDICNNIFLMRGKGTENNAFVPDFKEIESQPDNNRAYSYWKMIHENIIKYDVRNETDNNKKESEREANNLNSIEFLLNNGSISGIFNPGKPYSILKKGSDIRTNNKKYFKKIYETYKKTQTFKTDIIPNDGINYFLEDYNLKTKYAAEKNKKTEVYWLYKTLLENSQDIILRKKALVDEKKNKDDTLSEEEKKKKDEKKETSDEDKKVQAYTEIVDLMNLFLDIDGDDGKIKEENKNKEVRDGLEKFLLKYSVSDIAKLSGITYKHELEVFVKKMATYEVEKKTYNYVLTDTDFADDPNKAEIDVILAEKFKFYSVYSSSLKELATSRVVSNPYWKMETDKYVGVKKGKIVFSQDKNPDNIFEVLSACKEDNSKCKNKKKAEYLDTEIDELRSGPNKDANIAGFQARNVYEAYVQMNVIKGKITKENYGKLKCAYLNYSLGAMYQRMRKKTSENYIIKNKVYFDLEKEIKKADEELDKKNNPKKKKESLSGKEELGKSEVVTEKKEPKPETSEKKEAKSEAKPDATDKKEPALETKEPPKIETSEKKVEPPKIVKGGRRSMKKKVVVRRNNSRKH